MNLLTLLNTLALTGARDASGLYDETRGCISPNKTYIINLHVHVQKEVKDALVSLAFQLGGLIGDQIRGPGGENAAVVAIKSYLGTVIEELNMDLDKFNVQVNLVFEEQEVDQITSNGAFDPSCELGSAVIERTNNAMSRMKKQLNNVIGFHLFIFGCVYKNLAHDLINIVTNENCGRVIGVMWDGSVATKTLIKSAIIEGMTGAKDAYAEGYLTMSDKNRLCGFFEKCIGMTATVHGQLVNIKKRIRFTNHAVEDLHPGDLH